MGMPGYVIFNIANVVTLIGMASGTMVRSISLCDSIDCNDWFLIKSAYSNIQSHFETWYPSRHHNHPLFDFLLVERSFVLDCFPSWLYRLLVGISSFGLVALVISLVILFFYGVANYGFKFDSSFWFPRPNSILNNLGVFINSLAFSLMCLSQVVRS